ncbi:hypothetical protein MRX96_051786 [Rhipicephalus microplus]
MSLNRRRPRPSAPVASRAGQLGPPASELQGAARARSGERDEGSSGKRGRRWRREGTPGRTCCDGGGLRNGAGAPGPAP